MERYLTEKAKRAPWWEAPAMIASGLATLAGGYVAVRNVSMDAPLVWGLACALLLGALSAPLWTVLKRRRRRAQAGAIAKCLAESGQSSLTYGALERRTGMRGAAQALKRLLSKGYLRNIALDERHSMARFDGGPGRAAEPAPVLDTGSEAYNEILRQIRALNDEIDHYAVSRKIDRIEELTGGIFKLITEQPERASDARRFAQYYLPVTMKLLKSYSLLEDQRSQGENITASRQRIEAVLDTLIQAIERQHDRLFRFDAMDVEAEIQVLETMLSMDGLTGQAGALHT